MNIWLKTSASRRSASNSSLPTITEHRHRYGESEQTDSQGDGDSVHSRVSFSGLGRQNGEAVFNRFALTRTTNPIREEEEEWSYGALGREVPRLTTSKKSVRFSGEESEFIQSKRPYEIEQDPQETNSNVDSHYILNNDHRLKFRHIKRNNISNLNDSSQQRKITSSSSKEPLPFTTNSSFRQRPLLTSSNNQVMQSSRSSTSNPYSRILMSSIRPKPETTDRNNPLLTSTSRSVYNSMNVNYSSGHLQNQNLLNSKRDSLTKTTGRKQFIREHIIAVIEYCSNEIGLAIYNTTNGEIHLCQIIERLTYFRVISTLERFYPLEILYSSTLEHTPLIKKLMVQFRGASFKDLKRFLFDETKGYSIYAQRGNKDSYKPDNKFLAYSALHALLFHLENNYENRLNYSSLNIRWHLIEDLLVIESQTIQQLQVFLNAETRKKENSFVDQFVCLTQGGTRMLRANLLQPLANEKMIGERQDLVELLLDNKALYDMLSTELSKFKNFQIVTAKFIQSPKEKNLKSLKTFISAVHTMSHQCLLLQKFNQKVSIYRDKNYPILQKLFGLINDFRIRELREFIEDNFDEDVLKSFEGGRATKKDNFIFLFKADRLQDEFIQVQRITYTHTTEDILRTFKLIKEKSKTDLKLMHSDPRGYYIRSPKRINLSHLSELIEDDIIQITEKKDTILFNTTILLSLNNRLKESEKKLILACEDLLRGIIMEIQKSIDVLFEINYEMSVADMLLSFVRFVKHYQAVEFTRPRIVKGQGKLELEGLKTVWTNQSKFKISNAMKLEIGGSAKAIIMQKQANSFDQLNLLYSFGYLTILTQIGCFVPATIFKTDLYQTVLSKIRFQQNIESNLSHFQTELHQLKSILDNASQSNSCMILLDQLVKGTQYEEELALSMGVLEQLMQTGAKNFVLISDKFQLSLMQKVSCLPIICQDDQVVINTEVVEQFRRMEPRLAMKREDNPFQFMLTEVETDIGQTLQKLNFAPQFVNSFGSLI